MKDKKRSIVRGVLLIFLVLGAVGSLSVALFLFLLPVHWGADPQAWCFPTFGLGVLGATGCTVGITLVLRSATKPNVGGALVLILAPTLISLIGLAGLALSRPGIIRPATKLQMYIQYQVGTRDFREADLSGTNLVHANLSEADLSGANLSGADLSGAKLHKCNLIEADLSGADLTAAYLAGAKMQRADLTAADLSRADLTNAELAAANLIEADLIGTDLFVTNLAGAKLWRANLTSANLSRADLTNADLTGAKLSEVDLSWADLEGAEVTQAQLDQAASLEGATLPDGTVHE